MPKGMVTRDENGLLPAQREYLAELAASGSESDARQELNFTAARVARWHREDEAFRTQHAELVKHVSEATATRLKGLEEELPEHITRLLRAMKPIKVTFECWKCDEKNVHTITVDNAVVQARMVEMLMKAQGHLVNRQRIEGHIVHSEGLNASLRMALSLYNDGKQISEQSKRELLSLGLIEDEDPGREDEIEGEAREI